MPTDCGIESACLHFARHILQAEHDQRVRADSISSAIGYSALASVLLAGVFSASR